MMARRSIPWEKCRENMTRKPCHHHFFLWWPKFGLWCHCFFLFSCLVTSLLALDRFAMSSSTWHLLKQQRTYLKTKKKIRARDEREKSNERDEHIKRWSDTTGAQRRQMNSPNDYIWFHTKDIICEKNEKTRKKYTQMDSLIKQRNWNPQKYLAMGIQDMWTKSVCIRQLNHFGCLPAALTAFVISSHVEST